MSCPSTEPSGRQILTEEVLKNVSTMFTKMNCCWGSSAGGGDEGQVGILKNFSHKD